MYRVSPHVGRHMIIGDHTGAMGLYDQMRLMEEAGFTEVCCPISKHSSPCAFSGLRVLFISGTITTSGPDHRAVRVTGATPRNDVSAARAGCTIAHVPQVDVAWRQRDFFVCGGRRPPQAA